MSTIQCFTCGHDSGFTNANVRKDEMFCISCGEVIANLKTQTVTQEEFDRLRTSPFAEALRGLVISG